IPAGLAGPAASALVVLAGCPALQTRRIYGDLGGSVPDADFDQHLLDHRFERLACARSSRELLEGGPVGHLLQTQAFTGRGGELEQFAHAAVVGLAHGLEHETGDELGLGEVLAALVGAVGTHAAPRYPQGERGDEFETGGAGRAHACSGARLINAVKWFLLGSIL